MKIIICPAEDPMEGDFGINVKFIKESKDKDFDLRMWRLLNNRTGIQFIADMFFNISKGNVVAAEVFKDGEIEVIEQKVIENQNRKKKEGKILTQLMMVMGLIFIASPLWNPPDFPNLWVVICGYLITIGSTITYALLSFENTEKKQI